jgi:hypothetical protein
MTRERLMTIEAVDLPYKLVEGLDGEFDTSASRWICKCPKCEKVSKVGIDLIGKVVQCKCSAKFRCPWWNLDKTTIPGLIGFEKFERPNDLIGYDSKLSTN